MNKCPGCNGTEVTVRMDIGDEGDVEETICADKECGYILKRERIIERPDGTKHRRPQRVAPDEQPEGLSLSKGKGPFSLEEEIPSAEEMMRRAVQMREETIGKAARDLVRDALKTAADPDVLLKGEYSFVIAEDDNVPAVVLKEVLRELRERGYKPKRKPEPGVGTWIEISWPTATPTKQKAKGRSKKAAEYENQEITFQVKAKRGSAIQVEDPEATEKQRAAAKHRQQALKERSGSPK